MLKSVLECIVRWQTKRQSNFSKSQLLVWTTITSERQELESVGELMEGCSQIVLKCLFFGTSWKTGLSTNSHEQSQEGQQLVTDN